MIPEPSTGMQSRSIVYAGNDFSPYCSAEVIERSANPIAAEVMGIPGRAGAEVVSAYVPPVDVRVKLFLDVGFKPDVVELAEVRHRIRSWLCAPGGGTLLLPDDPEREHRDALLIAASAWSQLFESGECEVTFTLFDPIAYGALRIEREASFEVGGTWETLPEFRLVASAGSAVQVSCPATGALLRVEYDFAGGEAVVVDCAEERVYVNDGDARDCVTLQSDFFALEPGACTLAFSGVTYFETRFRERWA